MRERASTESFANINSIDDMDSNTVAELRGTLAGRFSIEKFSVDSWDWAAWSEKHQEIPGIEYDAQNSRIRIKACNSPLHEAATGVIGAWLRDMRTSLRNATGNKFVSVRSAGVILSKAYEGSEKAPDEGLGQRGQRYPLIAVEVAVAETSNKVFEDATRWLQGSGGRTKLVIVIDIKETISRNSTTQTADWGLSKNELDQLDVSDLTEHILQWHKDNRLPLVGSFQASLYLCFQNQQPRQAWKCEFSLNELESKCFTFEEMNHITTKELIPELDESHSFPLPLQEMLIEMQESLVGFQIYRASCRALKKVKEMRKISDRENSRA